MENNNLIAKVKRNSFLSLRQDSMLTKSEDIIQRTTGVVKYEVMETELTNFDAKLTAYRAALINANDGGRILIANKNIAMAALKEEFGNLADAFDFYAKRNVSFVLDAGLECRQKKTISKSPVGEIKKPSNLVIKPTDVEGCLEVSYTLTNKSRILNVAAEWREVGEEAWNNGNYFSGQRGKMKNLPSLKRVEVKLRSIGRGDTKSEWTVPIVVPVL